MYAKHETSYIRKAIERVSPSIIILETFTVRTAGVSHDNCVSKVHTEVPRIRRVSQLMKLYHPECIRSYRCTSIHWKSDILHIAANRPWDLVDVEISAGFLVNRIQIPDLITQRRLNMKIQIV